MSKGLFSAINFKNVSIALIMGYGVVLTVTFLLSMLMPSIGPAFKKLTGGIYIFIIIGALLIFFTVIRGEFSLDRTGIFMFLLIFIGVVALVILTKKIFPTPFEQSILEIGKMLPAQVQSVFGVS